MSFSKVTNDETGEITYYCTLSESYLTYKIDETDAIMMNSYIDYDEIKLFVMLLDSSIQDLKKIYKCEYLSQMVRKDDWIDFLCSDIRWTIVDKKEDEMVLIIKCNINSACACILNGFGFESNIVDEGSI
jgi:hypothetical protein